MNTLPFMRYSWMVSSPSVRIVTWGSAGDGVFSESSGGGGGSSSGAMPEGRVRAADCDAAGKHDAASTASNKTLFIKDAQFSITGLAREFGLAFLRTGLESARMVVLEDRIHDSLWVFDDGHEAGILHADHALGEQCVANPVEEPLPEGGVHQDQGHLADLGGLHQREHFRELVERAVAAGHHLERARELHEHDLAREEMLERVRDVLERVRRLFQGQLDVEADARAQPRVGALVRRFHDSRAAAGDHRE